MLDLDVGLTPFTIKRGVCSNSDELVQFKIYEIKQTLGYFTKLLMEETNTRIALWKIDQIIFVKNMWARIYRVRKAKKHLLFKMWNVART